jgi:hypothetical protein
VVYVYSENYNILQYKGLCLISYLTETEIEEAIKN